MLGEDEPEASGQGPTVKPWLREWNVTGGAMCRLVLVCTGDPGSWSEQIMRPIMRCPAAEEFR